MVLSLSFRRISIVYEHNSLGSPGKILSLQVHGLEKEVYILIVYSSMVAMDHFRNLSIVLCICIT